VSVCRVLRQQGCPIAARTYRAWKKGRPPSARALCDEAIMAVLESLRGRPESLYGRRKMTALLRRKGFTVAYCTVHRLMGKAGMNAVRRGRRVVTTLPAKDAHRAGDLLNRDFTARGPNLGVGGGLHLRTYLGRILLRRVRGGLLRPTNRGMAHPNP
jgi:transposase InsO family protein